MIVLNYISDLSILIPYMFMVSLELVNKNIWEKKITPITHYLAFSTAAQILSSALAFMGAYNLFISHIYYPAELVFLSMFFARHEVKYRAVTYVVFIITGIILITDNLFLTPPHKMAVYSAAISNFILFAASLRLLIRSGVYSLKLKYEFWFAAGFTFYFCFSTFSIITINTAPAAFSLLIIFNLVKNIFITKGLICYRQKALLLSGLS